jgi:hypothetical protein
MNETNLNKELEKEKEKLSKLAEEALKNNIPLPQDEAVMAQSRKIDALVVKIQKEKEKRRKARRER